MKKILICADDFGLTKNINESILELCSEGKVECVSVMYSKENEEYIKKLALIPNIKIGLHFYITTKKIDDYKIIKYPYLMYFKGYKKIIKDQFEYQYKELLNIVGRVDYIDSHHYLFIYPNVFKEIYKNFPEIINNNIIKLPYNEKYENIKGLIYHYVSNKIIKQYKLKYIGLLGIHYFNYTEKQLRDLYMKDSKINYENEYHFSTHPCKNPEDIVGLDSLVNFRKVDYLFLKNNNIG